MHTIFGKFLAALGIVASIIGIGEFIYWQRGSMSDNPTIVVLVAATIFNFIVMILFAYRSVTIWNTAKQGTSNLIDFIHDLSEYPYKDSRALNRQLTAGLRAAIAKNGIIPRDSRILITRLNEKDMKLGKKFEEIENDLKEKGLM